MFYYMPNKTKYNPPSKRYINLIIQGYKDCGWNVKKLLKVKTFEKHRRV